VPFSNFCFYGLAFDDVLPVVSCGGFLPEVDFAGNQLQLLSNANANANIKYQHVNFNLTSLNGVTVAIFGWTQDSPGPTYDFIRSLKNLPNTDKANAIAILAFEHLENTYLRPEWWVNLDHDKREFVITKVQSGLGTWGPDRTIKSLLPDQSSLVNARVVQEFVSTNITL
jgi:hypothetical protein